MDLAMFSQGKTNIALLIERLDGDEPEPSSDRLNPILDQMKAASIAEEYQLVFLFLLTTGKGRDAPNKVNTNHSSLDELVNHSK